MRTWVVVVFGVAVALAQVARAQEDRKGQGQGGRGGNRLLAMLDKDGDGAVSREEYKGTDAVFARLDADGDGTVSGEEAARAARYMTLIMWDLVDREALFKALDTNADGSISAEEMKAAPLAEIMAKAMMGARTQLAGGAGAAGGIVGRFDKNGDGKVSRDEFPAEHLDKFDRLDKNGDGAITADEAPQARGGKPGAAGPGGIIGRLDKNGDGKVSKEEFPQDKIQAFDRFDKNGDGAITADEIGGKPRGGREEKPDNF